MCPPGLEDARPGFGTGAWLALSSSSLTWRRGHFNILWLRIACLRFAGFALLLPSPGATGPWRALLRFGFSGLHSFYPLLVPQSGCILAQAMSCCANVCMAHKMAVFWMWRPSGWLFLRKKLWYNDDTMSFGVIFEEEHYGNRAINQDYYQSIDR